MRQQDRADEETALAFELLDAASQSELDRSLGNIVSATARSAGRPISPEIRRALYGFLKGIARQVLPIVISVVTEGIPAPAGRPARNGALAGPLMGLELEGLSPEDQELELAKQFVRLAATMCRQAALAAPGLDPAGVARTAAAHAARLHAPGLLGQLGSQPKPRRQPGPATPDVRQQGHSAHGSGMA